VYFPSLVILVYIKVTCGNLAAGFLFAGRGYRFFGFHSCLKYNLNFVPMADRHGRIGMGHQKPEISISLSEDSKLNLSVGGTEPEQVSSSFRSSLLFNPTEQHSSKPLTLRRPGMRGIQSVENFTVDNFFGFDEDSEDDLQWSFSPVKMAPRLKPVVSVPFAVSSTPNLKPNFTRQETKPLRLVNRGTKTRTALMSTQTSPEVSFTLDTGSETHSFSPTVFMDENVPMQHFMKVSILHYGLASLDFL
jgi:hypothetical protein